MSRNDYIKSPRPLYHDKDGTAQTVSRASLRMQARACCRRPMQTCSHRRQGGQKGQCLACAAGGSCQQPKCRRKSHFVSGKAAGFEPCGMTWRSTIWCQTCCHCRAAPGMVYCGAVQTLTNCSYCAVIQPSACSGFCCSIWSVNWAKTAAERESSIMAMSCALITVW